jgi:hypothetical protein
MDSPLPYKLARACSLLLILSLIVFAISILPDIWPGVTPIAEHTNVVLIISSFAFVLTAIGTASTVLLGWHADRRQSDEFRLKIEQLELQLKEARAKNVIT